MRSNAPTGHTVLTLKAPKESKIRIRIQIQTYDILHIWFHAPKFKMHTQIMRIVVGGGDKKNASTPTHKSVCVRTRHTVEKTKKKTLAKLNKQATCQKQQQQQ